MEYVIRDTRTGYCISSMRLQTKNNGVEQVAIQFSALEHAEKCDKKTAEKIIAFIQTFLSQDLAENLKIEVVHDV